MINNRKLISSVVVDVTLIDYLQRLTYELDGYKNILKSMMEVSEFKYNKEMYSYFMNEYKKLDSEFHLAINELKNLYCNEYKNKDVEVKVYFDTNTIEFLEENSCHCQ